MRFHELSVNGTLHDNQCLKLSLRRAIGARAYHDSPDSPGYEVHPRQKIFQKDLKTQSMEFFHFPLRIAQIGIGPGNTSHPTVAREKTSPVVSASQQKHSPSKGLMIRSTLVMSASNIPTASSWSAALCPTFRSIVVIPVRKTSSIIRRACGYSAMKPMMWTV